MSTRFKNRVLGLACLLLLPAASLVAQTLPQLGVYRWAAPSGPTNVTAYAEWLGQPDMWGEDFEAQETWAGIAGPNWILNPWRDWVAARPGRTLILSVPMLPKNEGTVSLATGATGAYNSHFQLLAQNLVAKGLGNTIIRLGWEMNGGWYKWAAKDKQASFIAYWQQIVNTMRAVPGTENLKFCFNPVYGYQQFPAEQAYPGDAYVDYIALDVYDESWAANTYPFPAGATAEEIATRRLNAWNSLHTGNHGLVFWKNFAASHGKPFALGEWGVNNRADGHGGLDNPQFIQNIYNFITNPANNVAWAVYFDVNAPDGAHQLSPNSTQFPLSTAKFLELFSGVKFQDDFTDGNSAGWTANLPAQWPVVMDSGDNAYKWDFNWTNTSGTSTAGNVGWTGYKLSTELKITEVNSWSNLFLYARYTDSNNYYRLNYEDRGGGDRRWSLQKRVAGVTSNLGASVGGNLVTGAWYDVDFEVNGSTLTAFVNGVQILQRTDTALTSGKIGLGGYKQDIVFDNIEVR